MGGPDLTPEQREALLQNHERRNGADPVFGEVPGAVLLEDIKAFIRRFVVLPSDEAGDLLALWVLHSHAFEAAWATPYLRITSAAPSSGKTLLLEVMAAICRNGWHAINPSVAVLYRKIDRQQPTLLLDEMDNYPLDDRRDALAVLNSGYKRGAKVDRCKENGDLESFNAFCPKAYAGLDKRQIIDTLLAVDHDPAREAARHRDGGHVDRAAHRARGNPAARTLRAVGRPEQGRAGAPQADAARRADQP
jgi:hypothetical protein